MRAALIFCAACWTGPVPTKPTSVVAAPLVGPPPDATIVKAEPLELAPSDLWLPNTWHEGTPPWTSIQSGWRDREFLFEVVIAEKRYRILLAATIDGALTPVVRVTDALPGGGKELVIEVEHFNDGGKMISIVACGVGASRVPSCGTYLLELSFERDAKIELRTPREGGVYVRHAGALHKLWFEFP